MSRAVASLNVKDHHSCVLYDSNSGAIVSEYHSLTYEGAGPAPDQREMETRALAISKRLIEAATKRPFDQSNIRIFLAHRVCLRISGQMRAVWDQFKVVAAEV